MIQELTLTADSFFNIGMLMSIYKLLLHDADACVRYMAKYAAKSEPRSMPVSTLFKECVEHLHVDSDPHMAF